MHLAPLILALKYNKFIALKRNNEPKKYNKFIALKRNNEPDQIKCYIYLSEKMGLKPRPLASAEDGFLKF